MDFIEFLKVIVLGIVEGFTEWLPISSTGHLILVENIIHFNVTENYYNMFETVIQLGAIIAVVILYFRKLNPFDSQKTSRQRRSTMELWIKIVIACIPGGVCKILLGDWMNEHLKTVPVVAAMLILYGILFIALENRNQYKEFSIQRVGAISIQTAFYIGLFQGLSLVPGTSRSGVTILGAMLLGCSRSAATEFSFFMGVIALMGASLVELARFGSQYTAAEVCYLITGMIVAFFVSVYSIKFLMGYIRRNDFKFFGYYRIVLGVIVIAYFSVTALLP